MPESISRPAGDARRFVRWIIRQPSRQVSEADVHEVSDLLRRVADRLDGLGPAVVEDVVLQQEATDGVHQLVVTVRFDRSRMRVDPGWLEPGVAASYDGPDPIGDDKRFMLALADELDARSIVDLGCGTGVLARAMAVRGRRVIGVDPSPEMLNFARAQPGAERVEWVDGDASSIGRPDADLIVMTGNVVQGIHGDAEWSAVLGAINDALRPNGCFAFGSRNWGAREWERWCEMYGTHDAVVEGDFVRATWRSQFDEIGGTIEIPDDYYRYRTLTELTDALAAAGFVVERRHGDWDGSPVSDTSLNIVIVAKKA
jgi:SAM-dependent methyltransferase